MHEKRTPKEWDNRLLADAGMHLEYLNIDDIQVDPSYQRALREYRIAHMIEHFDPAELTAIVVHKRTDGTIWVLDGQHRVELLRRLGKSVILADVREGYSIELEAHYFWRMNAGRKDPNSWEKFHARLRSKEPTATRILEIVEKAGFHLELHSREAGDISAVSALETIFNMGKLEKSLNVIATVWPNDKVSTESAVILGMGSFLLSYDGHENYDDGQLLTALEKIAPSAILRRAREIQIETGRSGQRGSTVVLAIRDAYNGAMSRGSKPKRQLYGAPIVGWTSNRMTLRRG